MLVDFSLLKLDDLSPLYQQIVKFVKIKIALGEVAPGDELPSRRMLSVILGVNPNTIQKCCKIMEDEGFIVSSAGAKSVLEYDAEMAVQMKRDLYVEDTVRFIKEIKRLKLQKDQVIGIIDSHWERSENGKAGHNDED